MGRLLCVLAFAVIWLESPLAHAAQSCALTVAASVPMELGGGGLPTIPAKMNGQDEFLLIDTGAFLSFVTQPAVTKLGLTFEGTYLRVGTAKGVIATPAVRVKSLRIGNLVGTGTTFYVAPPGLIPPSDAGSFGNDFLRAWDVDFDFASKKLNLISPKHCKGEVVYWTKDPYAALPFRLNRSKHIQLRVTMDGRTLLAIIDTGTTVTTMSLEKARELFGWKQDPPELKPLPAPAYARWRNPPPSAYVYPFELLSIQGTEVHNPLVVLVPNLDIGDEPLILGMSILQKLHLYIAYKERTLYFTAAGAR